MTCTSERWHLVGTLLGLVLVAALVLHGRPAGEAGAAAWGVRMTAARTAELAVLPAGEFLATDGLHPGRPATGRLAVRNTTGRTVAVVAKAVATSDLPPALHVRVHAGEAVVFDGPLAGASEGWQPFQLASGQAADVDFEVGVDPRHEAGPMSVEVQWDLGIVLVEA